MIPRHLFLSSEETSAPSLVTAGSMLDFHYSVAGILVTLVSPGPSIRLSL